MEINQQQITSLVRDLMQALGTFLVTAHVAGMTSDNWQVITGFILMFVPVVWGWLNHRKSTAIAIAAAIPDVNKVEVKATPEGRALAAAAGTSQDALVVVAAK